MPYVQRYPRQYDYNNVVDLVFSNPNNKPESHPCFIDAVTGRSITLYHMKRLVSCIHAGLLKFGLKRGDCVCVYSPNNLYTAPIYLGTLSAGCTLSPVNSSYVASELERQLSMTKAKLLIAHPSTMDVALEAAAAAGLPKSSVLCITEKDPRAAYFMDVLVDYNTVPLRPVQLTPQESRETVAYLIFSSGTTGKSKGVMLSHYNCIAMVTETCEYTGAWKNPDQRVTITSLPMYHAAGLNRSVTTGVTTGYIQVVLEKYTVENLCAAIERFKINDVPTAPPILLHLLNHPAVAKYDLSTLKSLNVGSAPVSPQVVRDIMKKFNAVCTQAYGMTEISPIGTMQTKETCVPESVGRLLPCMEGKVIDPEGQDLPWGSVGEICFRGPTVMIGYLDDPESTDATIDKDGWIRTGDQGFVDKDGNWFIQDRLKELIKYKGFQVAPAELEALLLQCPLVLDAAVIGVYNEQQATEFPRAYVVLRPEAVNDKDAPQKIVQWTHDRVAQHKRLRGGVKVVNEIPKSPTGKILRRTVRDMARKEDASVHIGAASKL